MFGERMHPLALTYDELKRVRDRMLSMLGIYPERQAEISRMVGFIDEAIEEIPEHFRLTRYEWNRQRREKPEE